MKVTERFSNRVENYVKYRPHYPAAIIPFLEKEIGLSTSSIVADIGSGTGISSEMFLKNGNIVYGIEPNKEMREAGEKLLTEFSRFSSIEATAEATSLAPKSIDIIISGQAFHWFDVQKAKEEFRCVLKPEGWIVLIWNDRLLNANPFHIKYEKLLQTFGTDYPVVNDMDIRGNINILFAKKGYHLKKFSNSQSFNYEGLKGRLLSSSYTPTIEDPRFQPMLAGLQRVFDEHKKDNKVEILYKTEVFYGQL